MIRYSFALSSFLAVFLGTFSPTLSGAEMPDARVICSRADVTDNLGPLVVILRRTNDSFFIHFTHSGGSSTVQVERVTIREFSGSNAEFSVEFKRSESGEILFKAQDLTGQNRVSNQSRMLSCN